MKKNVAIFLLFNIITLSFVSTLPKNDKSSLKSIKLYHYPTCPSCKQVVKTIKKNHWGDRVVLLNAEPKTNKKNYEDLKKLRADGKDECPFLVDEIHDETRDGLKSIIKYLKNLFK